MIGEKITRRRFLKLTRDGALVGVGVVAGAAAREILGRAGQPEVGISCVKKGTCRELSSIEPPVPAGPTGGEGR